jgi:hypothetical protein
MTPEEYINTYLRPGANVIRELAPSAKINTMGFAGFWDVEWIDDFVAKGGMDLVDVLSMHPGHYPRSPEFYEGWNGWFYIPQVDRAISVAGDKEVWLTEIYAPAFRTDRHIDVRTAADYLVREYVFGISKGVEKSEFWNFQDGVWHSRAYNPDDIEYYFGMTYIDMTPKPQYIAYGVMTEQLEGAVYQERINMGSDLYHGYKFSKGNNIINVLWSFAEKHETDCDCESTRLPGEPWVERWKHRFDVTLPINQVVTVTNIMGESRQVVPINGEIHIQLTGSPIFLSYNPLVPAKLCSPTMFLK